MRPGPEPTERPPKMMPVDALTAFVPAIEAGARALRRQADAAQHAFRMTDYEHHVEDAKALESLALRLDIRMPRW